MSLINLMKKNKSCQTPRVSRLYLQLRSKFALSFLLLILIPFLFLVYAAYAHSKAALEKNALDASVRLLEYNEKAYSRLLEELAAATLACAGDPLSLTDLKSTLFSYLSPSISKWLAGAYVIDENNIISSWLESAEAPVFNKPSAQSWFTGALENPSLAQIYGTNQRFYSKGRNKTVFSVAKALSGGNTGNKARVLLVDLDYGLLQEILEPQSGLRSGEVLILADNKNTVMYSTVSASLSVALESEISEGLALKGQRLVSLGTGKSKRLMTSVISEDGSWTFIHILPEEAVFSSLRPFSSPLAAISIIACPLLLILYFVVSSMHLNPINELTAVISGNQQSIGPRKHFDAEASNGQSVSDSSSFSEIDYLISKVYDIRLKQKEAELNSLQNQINPHFLYNTLESIRGAALYNGIHEIAAMSRALSLLFRYSISDKPLVTIREELGHLENYMSIQNFRYENRFELIVSIPPEFYSYRILKLTLQPLIENSIKHGLEMKLGKGIIKLEILRLDKNIRIQVSDNGIGMPAKKLEELNKSLSADEFSREDSGNTESPGTGIGVRNVNSRIKLYFGEQYGLKFKEAYAGTIVELVLPAVKED